MSRIIIQHIRAARLRYALPVAAILFAILDYGVLQFEKMPDLVLRNDGRSHAYTSYFFRQMSETKDRPAIAFFGASVMQGIMNTAPARTMPVLVDGLLQADGRSARCFNLAVIGNNLGDQLALASESIRNGADLLVVSLHFKLFSDTGTLGKMTCHKETVFYLRGRKDFTELRRKLLHVSDRDWDAVKMTKNLELFWAFFRERALISRFLTGDSEPIPTQFGNVILGMAAENNLDLKALIDKESIPDKRDKLNMWKLQPKTYHENNRGCYTDVKLDLGNDHFRALKLINELSENGRVKILFYLNPLNRAANAAYHYFDWAKHAEFARMTKTMAEEHGNFWVDMTDAVDNRYFTDGDHLTMHGHDGLAQAMTPEIEKVLDGVRP